MFLFKPHVIGPGGNITTPDVIVDCLFTNGERRSLGGLSQECWLQAECDATGRPAYAITALGGGALISPAVMISNGQTVVARSAWRLANLDSHIGEVTLNGTRLSNVGLPYKLIEEAGGKEDVLPRGYMLLRTVDATSNTAVLSDPVLDRELRYRVVLEPLDEDRWGDARPKPRYSVGPTKKDVPHFI